MTYAGIDYGLGQSNINKATGIRYGVISCHSLGEGFYDAQEMDYGDPTCPECQRDVTDAATIDAEWNDSGDYACSHCEQSFDSDECFPQEAIGWHIDDSEYKVIDCLDNDAMVIESPYYTLAQFCSPCVPGACSLDSPCENGAKAYCFGHDWFEGNKAPYPVYSVETNELVNS